MCRTDSKSAAGQSIQRWTTANNLIWTHYDDADEWAVFHPSAATVHLLNASARFLWTAIADHGAITFDELVAALSEYLGCHADQELIEGTRNALVWMDEAGLIMPVRL